MRWLPGRRTRRVLALLLVTATVLVVWQVRRLRADPTERILERSRAPFTDHLQEVRALDAARIEYRRVEAESGLATEYALNIPAPPARGADRVPTPLIILLGGQRTGRDAVELVGDTRGVLVAALSYPYQGEPKPKGLAFLAAIPRIQEALLDAPAAILLVRRALLERRDLEISRVELVGVSLGSPFVVYAGSLEQGFERVWSIHGSGRLDVLLERSLETRIGFGPLRGGVAGLAYLLAHGPPLAPERHVGQIAPRPFVMINAAADVQLPRECVESLFDAAREPKELVWLEGGHVRPGKAEVIRELADRVLDRLELEGLLPAD